MIPVDDLPAPCPAGGHAWKRSPYEVVRVCVRCRTVEPDPEKYRDAPSLKRLSAPDAVPAATNNRRVLGAAELLLARKALEDSYGIVVNDDVVDHALRMLSENEQALADLVLGDPDPSP